MHRNRALRQLGDDEFEAWVLASRAVGTVRAALDAYDDGTLVLGELLGLLTLAGLDATAATMRGWDWLYEERAA